MIGKANAGAMFPVAAAMTRWTAGCLAILSVITIAGLPVAAEEGSWGALPASDDTRTVYVSSSLGNDANNGLDQAHPVASVSHGISLLRSDHPDHLLLLRGDVWSGQRMRLPGGRSADEPMVIATWGDPALDRPVIEGAGEKMKGLIVRGNNVTISGLRLQGTGRETGTDAGLACNNRSNIVLDDVFIDGWKFGLDLRKCHDVRIIRSIIADNRMLGLFAVGVDGLTITDSIFDHNGVGKIRHHNIYQSSNCRRCVYEGNIFSRGGNYGLKIRADSEDITVRQNVFSRNRTSLSIKLDGDDIARGNADWYTRDVQITGNACIETGDRQGQRTIEIGNAKNVVVRNNILGNSLRTTPFELGIVLLKGKPTALVQLENIEIDQNIILNASAGCIRHQGIARKVRVTRNTMQVQMPPSKGRLCRIVEPDELAEDKLQFQANNWYCLDSNKSEAGQWYEVAGRKLTYQQWLDASGETGSTATPVRFVDPGRTLGTYNASIGGEPTFDAFIAEARKQRRGNWREQYTARAALAYIQAGFERVTE